MSRERGGKFGGEFPFLDAKPRHCARSFPIIFILFSHYNAPSAVTVLISAMVGFFSFVSLCLTSSELHGV